MDKRHASFTFLEYPVKEASDLDARYAYCAYQQDTVKYWDYADTLFSADISDLDSDQFLTTSAESVGLDGGLIKTCAVDPATETRVKDQLQQILFTNFRGTPTVFINSEAMVGPKPYRVYAIMLDGFFYWLK